MTLLNLKLSFLNELTGNSIVNYVYHPADGTAAIKKRSGSANYLNSLGDQGFSPINMIRALSRDINYTDVVLKNFNPVPPLTTNKWLPDAGAIIRYVETNFIAQRLTERISRFLPERLTSQYTYRHGGFCFRSPKSRSNDDFF